MQTLRSRGFSIVVHLGLWVLLYLAVAHLGGKTPPYRDAPGFSSTPQTFSPVVKLDGVFGNEPARPTSTNAPAANPFLTRYFVPPPTPAPAPPATTRKLEVVYQGFYQTSQGPKVAVLKLGEGLMNARVGALVATNVYVAFADASNVILTNTAGVTNILLLNTKKEIEVPVR